MSDKNEVQVEKICKNCDCCKVFDKKFLCYYGEPANIFFFGPKHVSACDTCKNWVIKQSLIKSR